MDKPAKNKKVLIYREDILPVSETFIPAQGKYLENYQSLFVGKRYKENKLISKEETLLMDDQTNQLFKNFSNVAYKLLGIVPGEFKKRLFDFAPDITHVHFANDATWFMPVNKQLKVPMVVTVHGYDILVKKTKGSFAYPIYQSRFHELIDYADIFIAVSNFTKQKLMERGCPEDKIKVHYIGVDVNQFTRNPEITPEENTVLFVGRLVEKKGCRYLIEAISKVQKDLPDAKLYIIGDGPQREELEALAAEKITNYEFLGSQPPNIVKEYLNKSKIFCVPSIVADSGDAETFGIVFIEAQAMKVPVVSFKTGGIPESVNDELTGLLAEEKDTEGLASRIFRLLSNQDLWTIMSENGRRYVEENYNLEKQTKSLEDIYNSVLLNKNQETNLLGSLPTDGF